MKTLKLIFFLCMAWVVPGFCHPHVFVDATVKVLFDKDGFTSVRNRWVYDELYSTAMMSSGDVDGDGVISPKENEWFKSIILDPLEGNNYYNYVQRGSDFLKAKQVKNFKASLQNRRLVLDFDVYFGCPATNDYSMLVVVVADVTNYILMTTDMESADVEAPDSIDVEFFNDGVSDLTLFKAFHSGIEGLYLRYKKK
ncbi:MULTISPECIES: DUF1007 family protein [unclassified Fibrobacter]|uniref:DUF1007 family protein n=1 Tax=unclassified Fibrobacter TaxID=2634177 RepID=UPI0009119028|nr:MULTISPECIES: DUF1007 family protein [unclassified Fibrobacter]MCQ2099134.1 DUF1007 family protein [Fibrobacter sp.]SHK54568.1 ABC-type uncharacterized transport system, substrate-binding protein [Fibrobacter sp. UWH6]SHK57931.1 ABC-type uncharacterized transport system, substrate-binding protein [Fibrobacter sp. UWH5]